MPTVTISDTEIDQILGHDKQRALSVARLVARRARGAAEADRRNRAPRKVYVNKADPDNDITATLNTNDAGFPDPNDSPLYAVDVAALDRARAAHPSTYASTYASSGGSPGVDHTDNIGRTYPHRH